MPWSDPEVRKAYHRKYYKENKTKWNKTRSTWTAERRQQHLDYCRAYQLNRNYGLSVDDYENMFNAQCGKCAICSLADRVLHVDHCHKSGRVRKLLCVKCNMALGVFEKYTKQIECYLEQHSDDPLGRLR